MKKIRKQYTPEFKAQIIELVGAGRPVPEVAEDFEVEVSCVYAWTPGRLDAWTPGRLDAWTPGRLDAWTPEAGNCRSQTRQ